MFPCQGIFAPRSVLFDPIFRTVPISFLLFRPSIAQPQAGFLVPSVLDEVQVFLIGYKPVRDLERIDPNGVFGCFIVKAKLISTEWLTYLAFPSFDREELHVHRRVNLRFAVVGVIGGAEGVVSKVALQIRDDQLLMLLFVI